MEIRHFVNGGELFFAKKIDCIWRGDVDGEASKRRWNGRVQSNYRAFMYYRLNDVTKCIFVWQWTNVRSFTRSLARILYISIERIVFPLAHWSPMRMYGYHSNCTQSGHRIFRIYSLSPIQPSLYAVLLWRVIF